MQRSTTAGAPATRWQRTPHVGFSKRRSDFTQWWGLALTFLLSFSLQGCEEKGACVGPEPTKPPPGPNASGSEIYDSVASEPYCSVNTRKSDCTTDLMRRPMEFVPGAKGQAFATCRARGFTVTDKLPGRSKTVSQIEAESAEGNHIMLWRPSAGPK